MNFTQAIIQALVESANGEVFDASKTAAVETAAGFWSRAFSMGTVHNANVHPQVLGQIGRHLCRDGESVWYIEVIDGEPVLFPAFNAQVNGGKYNRTTWMYDIQLAGPDGIDHTLECPCSALKI